MIDSRGPRVIALALILVVGAFNALALNKGFLVHPDEFLTLDRANSLLVHGDPLTIYSNNLPSFKKPPLQYWMIAGLWQWGADFLLALRLPSFVFGLLTLAVTGILAAQVYPKDRLVAPAAILLTASSPNFWESSVSALLDMGALFFALAALSATLAALKNPRWWYGVAMAATLGALQKGQVPLVCLSVTLVVLAATARWSGLPVRTALANRHFAAAMVLMALGMLAWPLLQWLKYGDAYVQEAFIEQVAQRFAPSLSGREDSWSAYSIFINGEPVPRMIGLAAALWLPFALRRPELAIFPALVLGFWVVVALASGYISPRYSLMVLPLLTISTAAIIIDLLPDRRWQAVSVAIICAIGLGPFKSAGMLGITTSPYAAQVPVLEEAGRTLAPGETLVVCRSGRGAGRLPAGAISYYASGGRPFETIETFADLSQLQARGLTGGFLGLCTEKQFDALDAPQGEIAEVKRIGGFVLWRPVDVPPGG
jgi:4-amino-4-deoxy-L-arabinose transferase-like glycosyltransferase